MDHVVSIEETSPPTSQVEQIPEMDSATGSAGPQKKNLLPFKILCLVLGVLVSLGWIGIIILLILKEEWQLVLIAWLMLYAAAHFCYWYLRRQSTRALSTEIRRRLISRIRGTEMTSGCEGGDCPPSYDELVKSELPPPAYYSVVAESPKLKRMLPWFLKKKTLEQQAAAAEGASTSTAATGQQESSSAWKSSASAVVVCNVPVNSFSSLDDEDEQPIELPSYETLMREAVQPVMTPIHRALASLPSLPPPYSPRPMESIAEDEQQQNE